MVIATIFTEVIFVLTSHISNTSISFYWILLPSIPLWLQSITMIVWFKLGIDFYLIVRGLLVCTKCESNHISHIYFIFSPLECGKKNQIKYHISAFNEFTFILSFTFFYLWSVENCIWIWCTCFVYSTRKVKKWRRWMNFSIRIIFICLNNLELFRLLHARSLIQRIW